LKENQEKNSLRGIESAMPTLVSGFVVVLGLLAVRETPRPIEVPIPIDATREIPLAEVVARLAAASGVSVPRPPETVRLPTAGIGGALTRRMLTESLGPGVSLAFQDRVLVVAIRPELLAPENRPQWQARLQQLAERARREAQRRTSYGMHALKSYRPNDPGRPTICLVHGVNSSSGGFVHMFAPLEEAGYGIVVYDYPFNRDLDETCAQFRRDWLEFRRAVGETRPWALVGHSMGTLVARSYVEEPRCDGRDVATLIMIAPVNQGASLAKVQTLYQLMNGIQALSGRKASDPLAHLGDGLGKSAEDLLPGSAFLTALNRRPRRAGVPYHILAGDVGVLSPSGRKQVEAQFDALRERGGMLGGLVTRLAGGDDLSGRLDELTDGLGDGCVSVARTKLAGVADHVVIHANHAELIRAPLLFPDPGPVACMPYLLRWLKDAGPTPDGTGEVKP
jgi:pimeloyl-ACP methyl ester carboxylesterase